MHKICQIFVSIDNIITTIMPLECKSEQFAGDVSHVAREKEVCVQKFRSNNQFLKILLNVW